MIKFPDLEVQPRPQRYTRIGTNIYRYESDTGFSAEIVVDDLGLVITYPRWLGTNRYAVGIVLRLFPWMRWGAEHSVGHYLDLWNVVLGLTLFPIGYLLHALTKRQA